MNQTIELLSVLYELSLTDTKQEFSPEETARNFIKKFLSRKSLHYGAAWKIDSYEDPYIKLSKIYSIPSLPNHAEINLRNFLKTMNGDGYAVCKQSLFRNNDLEGWFVYFQLNDFAILELYHNGSGQAHFSKRTFAPFLDVVSQFAMNLESRYSQEMLRQEVAQRKKAELSLMSNEDKYRRIIDNISLGLVEVDNNEVIQYANEPFLEFTGYKLTELIGRNASELFLESGDMPLMSEQTHDRKKGKSNSYEISMMDKFGNKRWAIISGAPNYDSTGELIGSIGIHLDVTQEKRLKQENEFKSAQLKKLFERSLDALISADSNGKIFEWSPQAEKIFGFSSEEIIGQRIFSTIIPITQGKKKRKKEFSLKDKKTILNQRIETIGLRKNGEEFPVELTVFPLIYNDEEYFTAFVRDISEIKESRINMERALERQKELNNMKSQFISMTSHELRTPLTTIKSNTELLNFQLENQEYLDTNKLKKNVSRIENNVERLNSLISNILMIGKLDSDKVSFTPERIDVVHFINHEILPDFETRNQKIKLKIEGVQSLIELDKKLFPHIITNLLENAVKYTTDSSKSPEMSIHFHSNHMTIDIRDYGIGIPENELPDLFNTFFRASNVGNIQGTGLGLTIVKQFVEIHHGSIKVESQVGSGTIFHLNFQNKITK